MEKIDSTAFTPGIPKTPSFGSLLYARRVATSLKAWLAEPLEAQMAGLRLLGPMATAMSSERAATDGIAFFVYRPEQAPVIEEARLLRDHLAQHADLIGAADLASAINRFLNEANPAIAPEDQLRARSNKGSRIARRDDPWHLGQQRLGSAVSPAVGSGLSPHRYRTGDA
jgi:hypothetical protein